MKYIGVDMLLTIWAFTYKPKWKKHFWQTNKVRIGTDATFCRIPDNILPPLEPCCLYKITKDAYVLIEDRRK